MTLDTDARALLREPPSTRYQGSKRKLLKWIGAKLHSIPFDTVLDCFGGTASVAYLFKTWGKSVVCNDVLRCNAEVAKALIEPPAQPLTEHAVVRLLRPDSSRRYDDVISRNFSGIYFTDSENAWLDVVAQNIASLPMLQQPRAYFALFQACLRKRPYNLFHRRNLYMRTADVQRGFGNKATWDAPFEQHFRAALAELQRAEFDAGVPCRATCGDALECAGEFDLVYIDPPYMNARGLGVDYQQFYHFLEGLVDYSHWESRIDRTRKHLPFRREPSPWCDPAQIYQAFEQLFARHAQATLVVSYRSDGIPSESELTALLRRFKPRVELLHYGKYQYALSKNRRSRELLLIGH
jgi:adenine-specific DNA methylase